MRVYRELSKESMLSSSELAAGLAPTDNNYETYIAYIIYANYDIFEICLILFTR